GSCRRHPIQFPFDPVPDNISARSSNDAFPSHSPPLAALASATAHELSEVITDARIGTGWCDDVTGEEIADKCQGVFLVPFVTFSNNSTWHVQGEWANSAFDAGTGSANIIGERGCLYGR